MSLVLVLGSGPNVVESRVWERGLFDTIVAINNAWAVRPDWDVLIHPEDFPPERRPVDVQDHQSIVTAEEFVPAQNDFGGFVYAGGTMAFTAGYWVLHALRPDVIGFMGCDMVYADGPQTHFYGKGDADPLRPDISLRSLEAKSARFEVFAAEAGCALVNLSRDASRLTFLRSIPEDAAMATPRIPDPALVAAARQAEAAAGYFVESGRYWEEADRFDPDVIDRIDALWLKVFS